jgi:hypothetical protein
MDYKKLYLEYKQKYLMSQKYLMEGGAQTQTQEDITEGTKYLTEESTHLKELLLELNKTSYTVFNDDENMKDINGNQMGLKNWGRRVSNTVRMKDDGVPQNNFHYKALQLKYLFINRTTLEDLGNCDEFFENLIAEDPQVYEKKFFTISYDA